MKVFFIDTNIFIQCNDLASLSWERISKDDDLLILISRPVLEEIDRFKSDGNSRRAKRARKASSFLKQIISTSDSKMIVHKSAPHVEVSFPPLNNLQSNKCANLDLSRNDDRIICETLLYAADNPDKKVGILAHDTNLMLTAKNCGLIYCDIPDDWLLPPEPDARDKKIAELENRIKDFEKAYPQIDILSEDENQQPITSLTINIINYDPLSPEELNKLISKAQYKNPVEIKLKPLISTKHIPTTGLNIGTNMSYISPTEDEMREYREKIYPKWIHDLKEFFSTLHEKLEYAYQHAIFYFILENSGNVPAENLIIEFNCEGGLMFGISMSAEQEGELKKKHEIKLPKPPSRPQGRWDQRLNALDALRGRISPMDHYIRNNNLASLLVNHSKPRDRNSFYWKPHEPSTISKTWAFECQEFRHQVDSEVFKMPILVLEKNITKGAVKCVVTAKNLPKPVQLIIPIKAEYIKGDTYQEADRLLDNLKQT